MKKEWDKKWDNTLLILGEKLKVTVAHETDERVEISDMKKL